MSKTRTMRLTYVSKQDELDELVGATIGQMYTEYEGKMGYQIHNFNKRVADVSRQGELIKITFTDGSESLARQAMVVYAKEEKQEDTSEEETVEDES